MPRYELECLEKFLVRTVYRGVDADSPEEALGRVKYGEVGYDQKEIEEGDEEFIECVYCIEEGEIPPDEDEDDDE